MVPGVLKIRSLVHMYECAICWSITRFCSIVFPPVSPVQGDDNDGFVVGLNDNTDVQVSSIAIAHSPHVVVSVEVFGVRVQLKMILPKFQGCVRQHHCLRDAICSGLQQLTASLRRKRIVCLPKYISTDMITYILFQGNHPSPDNNIDFLQGKKRTPERRCLSELEGESKESRVGHSYLISTHIVGVPP